MASQRLLIGFCSKSAAVADTVMVTKSTIMMPATTMWTMCGIVKHWTSGNAAMVYGAPLNQLQLSATRKTAQNLDGPDDWEALLLEAVADPHTQPNRYQQKHRNRVHDAKVESIALDDDRIDVVDVCNHLPDPVSIWAGFGNFNVTRPCLPTHGVLAFASFQSMHMCLKTQARTQLNLLTVVNRTMNSRRWSIHTTEQQPRTAAG
eukprot:363116-Chlamydomonas_euryale.AAC.2